VYGARYISDRYLPDKAIDLVDEAASALRLAQESKPDELEALDRDVVRMEIELESLKAETDVFSVERRGKIESDLRERKEKAEELTAIWQNGTLYTSHDVLIRVDTGTCVQRELVSIVSKISSYVLKRQSTSSMSLNVTGITNGPASLGSRRSPTSNDDFRRNRSSPRTARKSRDHWR
jgi:ATP-dependent Clp protease ATP-binding subunit ClpA